MRPSVELAKELEPELGQQAAREVRVGFNLPLILTRDELARLLAAPDDAEARLLLHLLYSSAMRIDEAAALRFADCDADGTIRVGARTTWADAETMALMKRWRKAAKGERVFGERTGDGLDQVVIRWGKQVGICDTFAAVGRRFSAQTLRHTSASHLLEGGMDLFVLKRLMGHAFFETAEMYTRTAMAAVRREYLGHHPLAVEGPS